MNLERNLSCASVAIKREKKPIYNSCDLLVASDDQSFTDVTQNNKIKDQNPDLKFIKFKDANLFNRRKN